MPEPPAAYVRGDFSRGDLYVYIYFLPDLVLCQGDLEANSVLGLGDGKHSLGSFKS